MYYVSENKSELELYNDFVSSSEGYDGVTTTGWAKVIEHPNGIDFAILAHSKYESELESVEKLDSNWFADNDI